MEALLSFIKSINSVAWGIPALILLVGTGLYLTIKLHGIQFRRLGEGFTLLCEKSDHKPGQISRFQALTASLSGTVGTGNIAGVATAITMGGPGAIFWMWISAVLGMATKFASCTLSVKYRQISKTGEIAGGPMYTLKYGLNMPKLAAMFALFGLIASFGIGNTVQANSIVSGLEYLLPQAHYPSWAIGVVLAIATGAVIIGGVKRIATVASLLIPFMAILYCIAALVIIFLHASEVPSVLSSIVNHALNPRAAGAGAMGAALRYGIARGVFSNEAGLGSAPIAHAAAKTNDPVKQGLVAMIDPLIDTLVICTMTALVIVITHSNTQTGLTGAALSASAFQSGLSHFGALDRIGGWVVGLGLVLFAYTTLIVWSYYGDRCATFLMGDKAVIPYRIIFTLIVVIGAVAPLPLVWEMADLANILMAIPNIISLILLANLVKSLASN